MNIKNKLGQQIKHKGQLCKGDVVTLRYGDHEIDIQIHMVEDGEAQGCSRTSAISVDIHFIEGKGWLVENIRGIDCSAFYDTSFYGGNYTSHMLDNERVIENDRGAHVHVY